ncbi:pilus assembly PilX N-terminal domain-containing protein, partial [Candidatus Aerophobetes bacterium]|nr:pilus assembly PilX N-terminal domain-containing protein [Candidatus Aerophobetes bacterium]
ILMLALTITGLAFLNAGVMENSLVRRQIHKNQAFYLAEAGVEHARVQLGKDWNDLTPIDSTSLEAGTYNVTIYTTDSSGADLPATKRRVQSIGAVGEISKTVEVILRKPPTGSGVDSALTAGGDIIVKGSAEITPPPEPEDEFYNFELGENPGDGLSLFEEIFSVTKEEMKAIAQRSPNRYYDGFIKNDIVENITWVDGAPDQSEITTDTWSGSGIWIVNGDLKITGGTFEGILWVIGSLYLGAGNPVISGAVFVECGAQVDTTVTGNATIELNTEAVDDAFGDLGTGAVVEFWQEF